MPKNETTVEHKDLYEPHKQPTLQELFAAETQVNENLAREQEERERAEVMERYGLGKSKSKKTNQPVQAPVVESDITPELPPESELNPPVPPEPETPSTPNPFAE